MPQPAIVVCRFRGKRDVNEIDDLELEELRLDRGRFAVIAEPLQHFREDDRRQADPIVIQMEIKPLRFRVRHAIQEIDPNGTVDNDQGLRLAVRAHRVEIAFPLDLAAQTADTRLPSGLNQQPQPFFDCRAFGGRARAPQRLCHQLIVYVDVCAHDVYRVPFYVYNGQVVQTVENKQLIYQFCPKLQMPDDI